MGSKMKPPSQQELEVIQRLSQYGAQDPAEQRRRLVELWRGAHPDAEKEASVALHPLKLLENRDPSTNPIVDGNKMPDQIWINDVYHVTVRFWQGERVFGSGTEMVQLGISTLDGTARHDWREFQAIKNQLVGKEVECFELYPAESRLLDPSNYFALWCFPGIKRIKVGNELRRVYDAHEALAPQRQLPKEHIGI